MIHIQNLRSSIVFAANALALMMMLTYAACAFIKKTPVDPNNKWEASELLNRTLTFKDDDEQISFTFGEKNLVAATIGSGGTFTAPLFYWGIDQEGALNITEDEGGKKKFYRIVKLEKFSNGFKVDCDGELQVYYYR